MIYSMPSGPGTAVGRVFILQKRGKLMRILNFGSLNLDYVYQVDHFVRPEETLAALGRMVKAGGKGLNQSVALARAGLPVCHAGVSVRAEKC